MAMVRSLLAAIVLAATLTHVSARSLTPVLASDPPPPNACALSSIALLGSGGDQDWGHTSNLLAYDRRDSVKTYQVHTTAPDGSGDVCLTCTAHPNSPRPDRHKMAPTWHAPDDLLVLQAEMDTHPLSWNRDPWVSELVMNGLWTNLYAVTADGGTWTRLTDYSKTKTDGAMAPHFSADGSRLTWSRLVGNASNIAPFGVYRLMVADFEVSGPSLSNIQDITPDGAHLVEAHGFSPDGTKVLFTSDLARDKNGTWGMDEYTLDLASGTLTNLTNSPSWEEHGSYAPSGRKIAYMSSQPYLWLMFLTELMIRDVDTGSVSQLTHFNVSGSAEYTAGGSMATRSSWNADGSRLALTQQLTSRYPERQLWVLTFAGACGG